MLKKILKVPLAPISFFLSKQTVATAMITFAKKTTDIKYPAFSLARRTKAISSYNFCA